MHRPCDLVLDPGRISQSLPCFEFAALYISSLVKLAKALVDQESGFLHVLEGMLRKLD